VATPQRKSAGNVIVESSSQVLNADRAARLPPRFYLEPVR
jgi:hypothetical protein